MRTYLSQLCATLYNVFLFLRLSEDVCCKAVAPVCVKNQAAFCITKNLESGQAP